MGVVWLGLLILRWQIALRPKPPVAAQVQEAYVGKVARIVLYPIPGVTPLLPQLREMALGGMAGTSPERLAQRALFEGAAGHQEAARQLWSRVLERGSDQGWPAQLAGFYLDGRPPHRLPEPGFFRDQYALDAHQLTRASMQQRAEVAAHQVMFLSALLLVNLGASLLVLVSLPWWSERWRAPRPVWVPPLDRVLVAFLAWQLLATLVVPILFAPLPDVLRFFVAQAFLYVAGVVMLAPALRLRPAWPRPALLGLGVVGYWLCLPVVLLAVWLTSLVAAPHSVNSALDLVLGASGAQLVGMGLMVALAAPCFEEYLFRGGIFRSLLPRLGARRSMLVSAGLFAVVHADPPMLLPLTALGLVFAWLTWRSGSLVPSMVAHSFWNGATFLLLTLSRGG